MGALAGLVGLGAAAGRPVGGSVAFAGVLAVCVVGLALLAGWLQRRRLEALTALGAAWREATPERLEAAAREVAQAADTAFMLALAAFTGGALSVAAVGWALAAAPLAAVLLGAVFSGLVAPLAAMLAHLLVLPRARRVLDALTAAGLPAARLAAAVPVRFEVRRRLVLYAAVAVLTPMLLLSAASLHRTAEVFEAVRRAPDPVAARAVFEARRAQGFTGVVLLGGTTVLLVVVCGWLTGRALGQPLAALGKETERLAAARYERDRLVAAELETWAAARAMASMEVHLLDAVGQAQVTARGIRAAAEALVAGQEQQARGAAEQSAALMVTTATTEELARSARQIAANAQVVTELAQSTLDAAQRGRASAESFAAAVGQVREGNQAIADSVVRLNKRVQQVGRIIEFIDGIADKSDLLALNAELEGHKAGEVGQGFGLVAAEMRRLAENVLTSTREIARLIDDIRDATNAAVMASEAGVKATDSGAQLASVVRDSLSRIVEFANQSAEAMQSVSLATAQQQGGSDQLAATMEDINRSTRDDLESAKARAKTQAELLTVSKDLEQLVDTFGGRA
ncbi:MAG: methyl-accepting chemotaxis protein [Myxococcaceae bacterium]|nr:methyl-accepting chemotaxis protein [Myxococcaceae bacterium]MCA3011482.1 methyl-accepting chemotaxis protein [Myxococcaceae bacterium]